MLSVCVITFSVVLRAIVQQQLSAGCDSFASVMFLLSQFHFLLRHVDGGQNLMGKLSHLPLLLCSALIPLCLPVTLCYDGAVRSQWFLLSFFSFFCYFFFFFKKRRHTKYFDSFSASVWLLCDECLFQGPICFCLQFVRLCDSCTQSLTELMNGMMSHNDSLSMKRVFVFVFVLGQHFSLC